MRDIIKKLPKRRGFGKNRSRTVNPRKEHAIPVSVFLVAARFEAGSVVTPKALAERGIIRARGSHVPPIKIVGKDSIDKKLSFKGISVSASVREVIEKAGGSIE